MASIRSLRFNVLRQHHSQSTAILSFRHGPRQPFQVFRGPGLNQGPDHTPRALSSLVLGSQLPDYPSGYAPDLQGSRGPLTGEAVRAFEDFGEGTLADDTHVGEGLRSVEADPPVLIQHQLLEHGYG